MEQDCSAILSNDRNYQSGSSNPNSGSIRSGNPGYTGTAGSTAGGSNFVSGMFNDRESTERAYDSLHSRGYSKDEIDLMMSEDTRKKYFDKDDADHSELTSKAMEGAGKGSAIGGTVGAIVGVIAALGTSLVLPGLGLVIAGPIAAGLAGAGAGGLTGGIIGGLVGRGIPEDRAKEYESGIKSGKIVMGVTPRNDDDARYFEKEWSKNRVEESATLNG